MESLEARFKDNNSAKLTYLAETFIGVFLAIKPAIWALQNVWAFETELVNKAESKSEVIWITKILYFGSSAIATNSFFSTNLTYLVVARVFLII